jgi:hypothetical protein
MPFSSVMHSSSLHVCPHSEQFISEVEGIVNETYTGRYKAAKCITERGHISSQIRYLFLIVYLPVRTIGARSCPRKLQRCVRAACAFQSNFRNVAKFMNRKSVRVDFASLKCNQSSAYPTKPLGTGNFFVRHIHTSEEMR